MANDDHASIAQVASSKELKIGDTVSQGTWGELKEIETNTAVVIDRPLGARAFVNPALEINALRRYVAEIAVPTLLAGLALPEGIPSSVDLEDSGKSYPLRLSEGKTEDAISKGAEERMKLYVAAMNRQPEVPKVVFEDG